MYCIKITISNKNLPDVVPIGSVKEFFIACMCSVSIDVSFIIIGVTIFRLSESYMAWKNRTNAFSSSKVCMTSWQMKLRRINHNR